MIGSHGENTLRYDESRCSGCGLCVIVCPHGVFAESGGTVRLVRPDACMECGACQRNCPTGAIEVESGVGCATALFYAALTGREASCGPRDVSCCGPRDAARCGPAEGTRCGPGNEPCCGARDEPPREPGDEPCRG
jgi:NAD-dependent dihydropyrimidine dehydrogenase PreA subunit